MGYVRNAWYVACWSDDLGTGEPLSVSILGEAIVLFRPDGGSPAALEDRCVHRHAPLSLGRCEGRGLRCMYHGLLFDPSGRVKEIPGQDVIPPQAAVRSYPVIERHGWIWVWMGDEARADPALMPPAVGPDDGDWLMGKGALDYDAEASLISDNLLDFSHLAYVHANSFGTDESWSNNPMKITPLERGVRFERWLPNTPPAAFAGGTDHVDVFVTYDYLIPGILLMWSGSYPVGTAQACDLGRPDFSAATSNVSCNSQAITPMGDRRSRYFFCTGPHRDFGNEQLRDGMVAVTKMAFAEDKAMIEGQQRVVDRIGDAVDVMPTIHDRGVTLYTRLVARMVKAERQHAASDSELSAV